jgi:hypothetical protein
MERRRREGGRVEGRKGMVIQFIINHECSNTILEPWWLYLFLFFQDFYGIRLLFTLCYKREIKIGEQWGRTVGNESKCPAEAPKGTQCRVPGRKAMIRPSQEWKEGEGLNVQKLSIHLVPS